MRKREAFEQPAARVILPLVPGRSGAARVLPPDRGARWLPDTDEVDADGVP